MSGDYVCSTCKGKKIEMVAWVGVNDGYLVSGYDADTSIWCENCQRFVEIEDEKLKS